MKDLTKMTEKELRDYIGSCCRAETSENKRCFIKGMRCALIGLGYDPEFVNGKFYDLCLDVYEDL